MFNLSKKFKVLKKIPESLKVEFVNQLENDFWEHLNEEVGESIKAFTPTKPRYIFMKLIPKQKRYHKLQKLSIEEQREILASYREFGWSALKTHTYQVPNYKYILEEDLNFLLDYLNTANYHYYETKHMILKYLCFLNDKGYLLFPILLTDYPFLNADDKLRRLVCDFDRDLFEEHMKIHKQENIRFFHSLRAFEGCFYDFEKVHYLEAFNYIENCKIHKRDKVPYLQLFDSMFYVSSRKRKKLDPEFVINRYAGDWYSYAYLQDFDGMGYYQEELELFLINRDISPGGIKYGIKFFIKYLMTLDYKPKYDEFERLVHIYDPSKKNKTFMDFLLKADTTDNGFNRAINQTYKFFDFLRKKGKIKINPIFPREDYKNKKVKKRGTHRKCINEELINDAKKLLLENNMAFSKQFTTYFSIPKVKNHKTGKIERNVWSPSCTIALYTLLDIPIRGIQVQLLDSGEGDEYRYCFEQDKIIKNNHPLAEKGRNENFIRKRGYEDYDGEYYSLWITTNKAITDGYEIPYASKELRDLLKIQYEYLETYDPNPIKIDKNEIVRASLSKNHPKFYPLFRDLSSRKKTVLNKQKIEILWGLVCRELENRYQERGIDVCLTKKVGKELRSRFDIHTLRVTGITHLLDKGVPLNIVSKYVAGHSSFAMTLWYNNPSPVKLREHLEKAKNKVINNGELNKESFNYDISEEFIGDKNYLEDNKGMLSIGLSGICPYKNCEKGGEKIGKGYDYKPVTQGANGPNCFNCRFFITGPKFIMGQMIEGNLLIREIQKKVQFLDKLKEDIMDCEDEGNIQKMNVLKGQKEIEEDKYRNMLHEWWSRVKTFEASRKMIEKDNKNLVVLGDDTKLALKEMNSFELLHNITTMGEFFPEFTNFTESFNEIENIMNKFLMKNDINPFILNLEGKEKIKACNLMGDMLLEISEQYKVEDLLEGKVLLKDIPELSGRITKLLDYRRK